MGGKETGSGNDIGVSNTHRLIKVLGDNKCAICNLNTVDTPTVIKRKIAF